LITLSSVELTFDSPLADPSDDFAKIKESFNFAVAGVFLLEAIIKIVAFGFLWNGKESYLR